MKHIKLTHDKNISFLTLARPQVKNAFHPEMIAELTSAFLQLNTDNSCEKIILRGEGSAFCAGADISWMKEMIHFSKDENKKDSEKLWEMFDAVRTCVKPIITIAQGHVFGGALGLLACSDYVYAEKNTKFCFSEVKLGLAPAVISSFVLKKMALSYAHPLMLSGEIFNSDLALQNGLIQKIFNSDISNEEIRQTFFVNGPNAMIETKKLLLKLSDDKEWQTKKSLATSAISELRVSEEAQSRLNLFLKK